VRDFDVDVDLFDPILARERADRAGRSNDGRRAAGLVFGQQFPVLGVGKPRFE